MEDGEGERCLSGEYRRFPSRCRTSGHRVEAISGFCVVWNQKAHIDVDSPPVFLLGLAGGGCLFWDSPCLFSSNSCRTSITLVGDIDLGLLCVAAPPIRFLGWGTTTTKKFNWLIFVEFTHFTRKNYKTLFLLYSSVQHQLTVCFSVDSPPRLHTWSSSCFSLAMAWKSF